MEIHAMKYKGIYFLMFARYAIPIYFTYKLKNVVINVDKQIEKERLFTPHTTDTHINQGLNIYIHTNRYVIVMAHVLFTAHPNILRKST